MQDKRGSLSSFSLVAFRQQRHGHYRPVTLSTMVTNDGLFAICNAGNASHSPAQRVNKAPNTLVPDNPAHTAHRHRLYPIVFVFVLLPVGSKYRAREYRHFFSLWCCNCFPRFSADSISVAAMRVACILA